MLWRRHLFNTQNYVFGERVLLYYTNLFIILSGHIFYWSFTVGTDYELLENLFHFEKYFSFFSPQTIRVPAKNVARTKGYFFEVVLSHNQSDKTHIEHCVLL